MKKETLWKISLGSIFPVVLLSFLYAATGVHVIVRNDGTTIIRNVIVETAGGSYHIGDIEPHSTMSVRVDGDGGSHVELDYLEASAQSRHLVVDTYFESSFRGTVEADVRAGKLVGVKNDLKTGRYYGRY